MHSGSSHSWWTRATEPDNLNIFKISIKVLCGICAATEVGLSFSITSLIGLHLISMNDPTLKLTAQEKEPQILQQFIFLLLECSAILKFVLEVCYSVSQCLRVVETGHLIMKNCNASGFKRYWECYKAKYIKKSKMKNRLANDLEWLLYCPIFPLLGASVNVVHPSDPHASLLTISKPTKYTVIQNDARVMLSNQRYS